MAVNTNHAPTVLWRGRPRCTFCGGDFGKHSTTCVKSKAIEPSCICNAGVQHYGNCPLATPANVIKGPGE